MGNTELVNGFQPWLYTNISSESFPNTNAQASPQANELILSPRVEPTRQHFILKLPR